MLANKGYLALGKETTKGTAVIPTIYVPYYDDDLFTNINADEDAPIVGNKFERYQVLLGLRSHVGKLTTMAEPNTAGHILNMILTKGNTSGGDPYTHPYTLDKSTDPKSYTLDIQKGNLVARFMGVEASELDIDFDENKMVFKLAVSALKSFIVREISGYTGTGPYTLTFKTNYDPSPTTGLVVGDTLQIVKSNGTTIDLVVATIPNGTQITCVADVSSVVSGDLIYIKAATPSYTLREPFMWALSEFRFGADAGTALGATQTRLEKGSKWMLKHNFEDENGAQRSGSFDPAALLRTTGDIELDIKKVFDDAFEANRFLTNQGRALVIRHFSEGQDLELRITINKYKFSEHPVNTESKSIVYSEMKALPEYDGSAGQAWDIKVINKLSSI